MTLLTRWKESAPDTVVVSTSDPAEIAAELAGLGVRFEQWPVRTDLDVDSPGEVVLEAYRDELDHLVTEGGYRVVDVAQLHPNDDPSWADTAAAARGKFLAEHTHAEDEIRFFVHGSGIFYLHLDSSVVAVLCESGDLISVPALTKHWFDMGTRPDFTAIRLFLDPDGWVGTFTGDAIASNFADYDTILASR